MTQPGKSYKWRSEGWLDMIEILHIQIVCQLPDMADLSASQPLFIFRNYDKEPEI